MSNKEIWVIAEYDDGGIKKSTWEAISAAGLLSGYLKLKPAAVILGNGIQRFTEELSKEVEIVYYIEHPLLSKYDSNAYVKCLHQLIKDKKPAIIIASATIRGKDYIPRLSGRLNYGLITDCIGFELTDNIIFKRSVYGGRLIATVKFEESELWIVTVRPRCFEYKIPLNPLLLRGTEGAVKGEILHVKPALGQQDIMTVIQEIIKETGKRPDLSEADVIVSGGRGMKGAENFKLLEDLADALGGAVGASRAVVDAGWLPHTFQIGQTGRVVSPMLYIACGISGAPQHLAGMSTSKCIVAINKDLNAPIFKIADYGIVDDLFKVVPVMIGEIKKDKNN
ncbi:MAG: electron transfer flavoprotein subunit alpha/FixB family protein [Nitrospinae bacterium]|nr:electron transfer flavoprotein subunit alpha/FixB family protein [Nitrospinota bacterium]